MKISELIALLETELEFHGDLPIYLTHEWTEPLEQGKLCTCGRVHKGVAYAPEHKDGFTDLPERVEIT